MRRGHVALFCGAGISANSGMPTARELIDRLADALQCEAQDRAALSIDRLPFEAFLQILSEGAPLEPMIGLYKASRPTGAHRLVARLVRRGYLRSVFTTNFDLLLERAFAGEGLRRGADYKRLVRLSEFAAYPDRTGCPQLVKIHGSADHPDSLAATIRAVASRQFSVEQTRLLRALFAGDKRRTILVIGYSGSDKFDIMPQLAALPEPRASILVVTHLPGASIANAIVRTNASLPEGNNWKSAGPITEIQIDTDLLLAQLSQALIGEAYQRERLATRWRGRVDRWVAELARSGPARSIRVVGRLFEEMGDIRRSADYFDRGLTEVSEGSDPEGYFQLHRDRGRVANLTGDYRQAIVHGRKALSGSRKLRNAAAMAGDLGNLGLAFYNLGRTAQAIRLHRRGWYVAKSACAEQTRANQLGNIGLAYRSVGRYARSASCHALSIRLNRSLGSVRQEAGQLANLGLCCTYQGDIPAAERYHSEALHLLEMVGDVRRAAVQKGSLGTLRQKQGDHIGAVRLFREALAGARKAEDRRSIINQLNSIAETALETAKPRRALVLAERALLLARLTEHRYSIGVLNVTVARARKAIGDDKVARRHALDARELLSELVNPDHPYRQAADSLLAGGAGRRRSQRGSKSVRPVS